MPMYQRYSPYRGSRSATSGQLIRWAVYFVILVGLVLLVSGCFRGSKEEAVTEANTNAPIESANTNALANLNAAANSNTNGTLAAVETDINPAEDCSGVISQGNGKKTIALTFGGRGTGANAAEVVSVLREAGVPAGFFFTGTFAKNNPEAVRAISQAGYRVYNQSDTHPDFEELTEDEMLTELEQADEKISLVTGQTTKPFFRPPYGSVTETVAETVIEAGYCPITWTVDGLDWQSDATAAGVKDRVLGRAGTGTIVLLHVGSPATVEALTGIITELKADGYSFISLSDLVKQ